MQIWGFRIGNEYCLHFRHLSIVNCITHIEMHNVYRAYMYRMRMGNLQSLFSKGAVLKMNSESGIPLVEAPL